MSKIKKWFYAIPCDMDCLIDSCAILFRENICHFCFAVVQLLQVVWLCLDSLYALGPVLMLFLGKLLRFHPVYACSVTKLCSDSVTPWTVEEPIRLLCPWGLLARILEWAAILSSRGSSQPRDWACISCIGRHILCHWAAWDSQCFSLWKLVTQRMQ